MYDFVIKKVENNLLFLINSMATDCMLCICVVISGFWKCPQVLIMNEYEGSKESCMISWSIALYNYLLFFEKQNKGMYIKWKTDASILFAFHMIMAFTD